MFFRRNKQRDALQGSKASPDFAGSQNIRRRFHHFLLSQRKGKNARTSLQLPPKTTTLRKARFFKREHAQKNARLRKYFYGLSFTAALFGGLYIAFLSPVFVISKITIEKNGNAVAASSLAPFLDSLKEKNIIMTPTGRRAHEIEQAFKNQILLVRIKKSYPNKVAVKIDEYPAVLNVIIRTPEARQQFVINQIGYSIAENIQQKELPVLFMDLPKAAKKNTFIIDRSKLAPIADGFAKFGLMFGMKVPSGEWKKVERELHLKTEKNFIVWLDLTADIDRQLSKLKRALVRLDIYNEPLDYIDLRIAGADAEKVIFKRRVGKTG